MARDWRRGAVEERLAVLQMALELANGSERMEGSEQWLGLLLPPTCSTKCHKERTKGFLC